MEKEGIRIKVIIPAVSYSLSFKKMVVAEYERGVLNKDEIQRKYGIGGNSRVLDWCRKYGKLHYPEPGMQIGRPMKDPQKRRIKELEKALEMEKLKVKAYEKLIEITEKREGISILKKDGAKQSENLEESTPGE
jgi:transposase